MPCTVVALVNSSKLGISKRKMVVGCSVSSTRGQRAETITESASFVGQGSFSRLGIIITFSLVWTSVKHEFSACRSWWYCVKVLTALIGSSSVPAIFKAWVVVSGSAHWGSQAETWRQTCFTVTSIILMSGTGAKFALSPGHISLSEWKGPCLMLLCGVTATLCWNNNHKFSRNSWS